MSATIVAQPVMNLNHYLRLQQSHLQIHTAHHCTSHDIKKHVYCLHEKADHNLYLYFGKRAHSDRARTCFNLIFLIILCYMKLTFINCNINTQK